jgi:hypothetical protein
MLKDLIPNIEDLITAKELKSLEALLSSILKEKINDGTDRISGSLVLNKSTGEIVKNSLKEFYKSKQYQNSIAKYLINVNNFSDLKFNYYEQNNLFIERSEVNSFQKVAINEHLDYLNENGLNSKFNQPLREIIYSNINSGLSQSDLEKKLDQYIADGKDKSGKLERYVKQVAMQGADAYTSIIDQKIADKYQDKITGYIMSGSIIQQSSPQCKYCVLELDRVIKREDWDKVKSISDGLIENTTFQNLPTNKLHWGCRHTFTPKLT